MFAHLFHDRRLKHQKSAMQLMASGLEKHGIDSVVSDNWVGAKDADFIVCWGYRRPYELKDKPCLILEAGYINGTTGDYTADRQRFLSLSWNAVHGRSHVITRDCPADRWNELDIELADWKASGKYALVCEQHPNDATSPPQNVQDEIRRQAQVLADHVVIRPHPLVAKSAPLSEALQDALVVVTWNSSAAVEAVTSGVPTIALDYGSIAWPVASHGFSEEFFRGSREQWAQNLAYRQWTFDEISDGTAWEHFGIKLHATEPQSDDRAASIDQGQCRAVHSGMEASGYGVGINPPS